MTTLEGRLADHIGHQDRGEATPGHSGRYPGHSAECPEHELGSLPDPKRHTTGGRSAYSARTASSVSAGRVN